MSYTRTANYQVYCLTDPIKSSIVWGGAFSALDIAQGRSFSLPRVGKITLHASNKNKEEKNDRISCELGYSWNC